MILVFHRADRESTGARGRRSGLSAHAANPLVFVLRHQLARSNRSALYFANSSSLMDARCISGRFTCVWTEMSWASERAPLGSTPSPYSSLRARTSFDGAQNLGVIGIFQNGL
jgi:hypothetical protein